MVIDAHQHFWIFDPVRESWITPEMAVIQKDFMPADLEPVLRDAGVDGTVLVQVSQSEEENEFQLANAEGATFIKGVVGWVDLQCPDVEERMQHWRRYPKMKG